jgi:flagella basal body P-ring formation protein FlgA
MEQIPLVNMKTFLKTLLVFLAMLAQSAFAQAIAGRQDVPRQDPLLIRQAVEQFLRIQTTGLPGEITISVSPLDPRLNLAECALPEAFMPNGARAWGKTSVGVRCSVPSPWTIYVPATVRVLSDYYAAAAPLAQGQTIGPNDIAKLKGDLTTLPPGIITDQSQAIGRTASMSLQMGTPLRQDALRNQAAVQQGQTVRLVSGGAGFRVSTEGRALNNAGEGQMIQARTASGQTISGIAKMGGIVEVAY